MSKGLALAANAPVVVALIGQLAVAVAAVVVVLAIVAVIVMVLRNNGTARQAAGGLGYDARQNAHNDYAGYDAAPSPWARPGGPAGGNAYAGQAGPPPLAGRTSGANWGQNDPQGGAWGGAPAAAGAWGNGAGGPAMNGMPRAQAQNPWEGGAPDGGAPAWDNQGNQGWGGAPGQQPGAMPAGAGAWQQPDAQAAAPWGAPQAAPAQPGAPWGAPQAAPEPNAWGVAAPTSVPPQNAWGVPAQAPSPQQAAQPNAWGVSATPSGPNWGAPPTQPWAGQAAQGGYDAPPPPSPYGGGDRGQVGTSLRPGAIMVKQGKEPGRVFEIRGDRLTIGRSRDSDIFLEDLAVSRLHAIVYREPSGQCVVRDENSANGTTVNGQRITEHVLDEGDEIGLGQTILTFVRR